MNVCDLKVGQEATVTKVELTEGVRERLKYLGVTAGATVFLLKASLFKRTFLLRAGSAKIAVGREVAEGIILCKK